MVAQAPVRLPLQPPSPSVEAPNRRAAAAAAEAMADAAAMPSVHSVIRTLAIALVVLAMLALVPGRALFRPWHVRMQWMCSSWHCLHVCHA